MGYPRGGMDLAGLSDPQLRHLAGNSMSIDFLSSLQLLMFIFVDWGAQPNPSARYTGPPPVVYELTAHSHAVPEAFARFALPGAVAKDSKKARGLKSLAASGNCFQEAFTAVNIISPTVIKSMLEKVVDTAPFPFIAKYITATLSHEINVQLEEVFRVLQCPMQGRNQPRWKFFGLTDFDIQVAEVGRIQHSPKLQATGGRKRAVQFKEDSQGSAVLALGRHDVRGPFEALQAALGKVCEDFIATGFTVFGYSKAGHQPIVPLRHPGGRCYLFANIACKVWISSTASESTSSWGPVQYTILNGVNGTDTILPAKTVAHGHLLLLRPGTE